MKTLKDHGSTFNALVINKEGHLISGSGDSTIKVWDIEKGKHLKTLYSRSGIYALVINKKAN